MSENESISFEEALQELNSIIMQLERGELSLEESLKKFERGTELSQVCEKKLKDCSKKLEVLRKTGPQTAQWEATEDLTEQE